MEPIRNPLKTKKSSTPQKPKNSKSFEIKSLFLGYIQSTCELTTIKIATALSTSIPNILF